MGGAVARAGERQRQIVDARYREVGGAASKPPTFPRNKTGKDGAPAKSKPSARERALPGVAVPPEWIAARHARFFCVCRAGLFLQGAQEVQEFLLLVGA